MGDSRDIQPPLEPEECALRERLRRHVDVLASLIGERNFRRPSSLEAAGAYIERQFQELDLPLRRQSFDAGPLSVFNLEAQLTGARYPDQIVVVGAHYDSAIRCPGANDNATGVAAVIEIARALRGSTPARTLRFVAFVNEEPPFFHSKLMGSWVYAHECAGKRENIVAMFTPETIGCYSDQPRSQRYPIPTPFPLSLLLPSVGDFLLFVSNIRSIPTLAACRRAFARTVPFRSRAIAAPTRITGIDLSDQWSFWDHGYPGIMITDTAPFRYAHYHTPQDTLDKIDFDRTARAVHGLIGSARHLAR